MGDLWAERVRRLGMVNVPRWRLASGGEREGRADQDERALRVTSSQLRILYIDGTPN